jgi:uncharacterized membrane protein
VRMPFPHEPFGPFGWLFAVFGGLAWLAILAGLVLLVIWALRVIPRNQLTPHTAVPLETPLDMLARRFAMGEISAEEFERGGALLRGEPTHPSG